MGSNRLSYIGLAYRAGSLLVGTAACEKGIKKEKVCLLLMQQGLSIGSKQGFIKLCERNNTDYLTVDEADNIGSAIGRQQIMVLGVTDKGFANTIKKIFDSN